MFSVHVVADFHNRSILWKPDTNKNVAFSQKPVPSWYLHENDLFGSRVARLEIILRVRFSL